MSHSLDKLLGKFLPPKGKQWAWFIIIWCTSLAAVMSIGFIIRYAMGIA